MPYGMFLLPETHEKWPRGKEYALSVKTSIPTPKMDSKPDFYYTLKFFNKPLKKGLVLREILFFSESDETLGGPSTCPYDSI